MPNFKLEIPTFEFKYGDFKAATTKAVLVQLRNGARAFARAAIRRVPVRTGFAKGGWANLAEAVGGFKADSGSALFAINNLISTAKPKAFGAKHGRAFTQRIRRSAITDVEYYYPGRVLKTPENARRFSTQPESIFTLEGNVFSFNYQIRIIYYRINDFFPSRSPTAPWGSFEAGREAFFKYLQNNAIKNMPRVTKFVVKSTLSVSGTSIRTRRQATVNA